MEAFSALLDRLSLTPQRNAKIALLTEYFGNAPDPDRGYALAAITGDLDIPSVKPAMLRALIADRYDEALFAMSYDYVGDLAETIALVWPARPGANRAPDLSEIVETLQTATRAEGPAHVERWLDALGATQRWALLKLVTGGLRIGVSARLAKTALAAFGDVDVQHVEEIWHGIDPPYESLFAWLEGHQEKPEPGDRALFRPVMLATALEEKELKDRLDPSDYAAEWKWDGVRVQAVCENGYKRLYSRTGDEISGTFPDVLAGLDFHGAVDGELLVRRKDGSVAPFGELQQRLNRKTVSKKQMTDRPAFIRAYDLLTLEGEDWRKKPFAERRARLEKMVERHEGGDRLDLSPLVPFETWEELAKHRADPPAPEIEGVMLKRWDSVYQPGRPKGPWFKWKQDPYLIDAVLLYAQRGHGKRSSFYSDYTFGVWREGENGGDELVPVGKAYFGFTDEELKQIDRFVRDNTIDRFGPVRAVKADKENGLVLEIAFEGLNRSARHKSGVAMRFPRIHRLRWDKPAAEADRLETLEAMLPE